MDIQANQELIRLISTWGYPLMLLLMVIEGPIASLTAAFMASLGYFNIFIVFCLSLTGDIIGDVILYYIGYFGGRALITKAERFLKLQHSIITRLEKVFQTKGAKIIFSVKATTGLVYITFLLAGATRMNFKKFLLFSFAGGLAWSSFLITTGYFFGHAAAIISQSIKYAGLFIFILAAALIVGISVLKKDQSAKILD